MATPEQEKQSEERRDLIQAIEELNKKVERSAESTEKAAEKISSATDRITGVVRSADELGKASLSLTKTGLVVAGSALTLRAAHKRGQLGNLAKGAAGLAGIFSGGVGGKGGRGLLGTVTKTVLLLSNLHPALKALGLIITGLVAARGLRGSRGGSGARGQRSTILSEARKQTALLGGLLIESKRSVKSIDRLQAERQARLDPFGRGPQFQQRRLQQLGAGITALQAQELGNLKSVINDLDISRQATSRALAASIAPLKTTVIEVQTAFSQLRGTFTRFVTGQRGQVGSVTPGGGGTNASISLLKDIGRNFIPGVALKSFLGEVKDLRQDFSERRFGGTSTDFFKNFFPNFIKSDTRAPRNLATEGPLGGRASRDLFRLQTLGVPQVLNAPATVRAGGESEYRFRVQQQRRGLQQAQTIKWQNEVLQAMQTLVQQDRLGVDDLFRARFTFQGVF